MHRLVETGGATATGGTLAIDPGRSPLLGSGEDLVGPVTVQLPIGDSLLNSLGRRSH